MFFLNQHLQYVIGRIATLVLSENGDSDYGLAVYMLSDKVKNTTPLHEIRPRLIRCNKIFLRLTGYTYNQLSKVAVDISRHKSGLEIDNRTAASIFGEKPMRLMFAWVHPDNSKTPVVSYWQGICMDRQKIVCCMMRRAFSHEISQIVSADCRSSISANYHGHL